jgi:hypothetical protein
LLGSRNCSRRTPGQTKKDALAAFDAFVETWGVKYDKAGFATEPRFQIII